MWKMRNADWHNVIDEVFYEADSPVIVTDPPFNIGYRYDGFKDRRDEGEYYRDLASLFGYGPVVMVHYPEALHRLSIEVGSAPDRVMSWVYNSNTMRQHRDIAFWGVEPDPDRVKRPYYSMKDKRCRELMEKTGGARSYDWGYVDQVKNKSKEKTAHPCQMPVDVMRWIVGVIPEDASHGTIIDPFAGSGTTGVACVMGGRDFSGIEMSEKYFEIAEKRLQQAEESEPYMQKKVV